MIAKALFLLAVAFAFEVRASVTLEEPQARSGTLYKATLRVAGGCGASPTTRLEVRLPEGAAEVRPQPKAGWRLEMRGDPTSEVAWSGGQLPTQHFDEFQILMRLPARIGTLRFPVVQICVEGERRSAPVLRLTPRR